MLIAETYYATDLLDGADFGLTTPYHFAKSARAALDSIAKQQDGQQELLKKLENAYTSCFDCGAEYGVYSVGCSSVWNGKCDVCGETKLSQNRVTLDILLLVFVNSNWR